MWGWLRTLLFDTDAGGRVMRAVHVPTCDPYREWPTPPTDRAATPRGLAEVRGALHAAGLRIRARRRGFDLIGRSRARVMRVRVNDLARIVPSELACGSDAPELLLDLALALVPLFGPIVVELPFAGALFVDGARDRKALGADAAERIQAKLKRIAVRAPISTPLLFDLARRLRQP